MIGGHIEVTPRTGEKEVPAIWRDGRIFVVGKRVDLMPQTARRGPGPVAIETDVKIDAPIGESARKQLIRASQRTENEDFLVGRNIGRDLDIVLCVGPRLAAVNWSTPKSIRAESLR
jgi:hypothetical protein